MDGKADLHLHTTFSDGAFSPRKLVERARLAGLTTISVTDHDHTGAIDEAMSVGREVGIEVIAGVELSTIVDSQDIHLLGYYFNWTDPTLLEYLSLFREERLKRAERIVRKLNSLEIPVTISSVLRQAGSGSVGRPHIANALLDAGLVESYQEAFARYIGFGRPAYEPKYQISPKEAIRLIASAGGLTFVAHPGNFIDESLLLQLIRDGVDGIEVVHPSHGPERTSHYRGIVSEYYLLECGGSDFHGGKKNDEEMLGKYYVPEESVDAMRRRLR